MNFSFRFLTNSVLVMKTKDSYIGICSFLDSQALLMVDKLLEIKQ